MNEIGKRNVDQEKINGRKRREEEEEGGEERERASTWENGTDTHKDTKVVKTTTRGMSKRMRSTITYITIPDYTKNNNFRNK